MTQAYIVLHLDLQLIIEDRLQQPQYHLNHLVLLPLHLTLLNPFDLPLLLNPFDRILRILLQALILTTMASIERVHINLRLTLLLPPLNLPRIQPLPPPLSVLPIDHLLIQKCLVPPLDLLNNLAPFTLTHTLKPYHPRNQT